jgi:autotransporter-associated beta strand protein
VSGTLTIGQAPLTITADDQDMTYGGTLPALTATYTGLVNNDTSAVISGLVLSTAPVTSDAGSYAITASGAVDPDYSISYVSGTLTIGQAPLTITADDQDMTYGGTLPTLTATYTGLVNNDTSAAISGLVLSTAPVTSDAGTYAITASGAVDPDYSISYVSGTLTIGQATLTVTADDQTRAYGDPDPAFTASFSGFVNGDTLATSDVRGSPSLTSSDTTASPVGAYPISAAQGTLTSQDYTFSFINGTLTVTQEVQTVDSDQPSLAASSNIAVVIDSGTDVAVASAVSLGSGGLVTVQDSVLTVPGIASQPGATGIDLDGGTLQASSGFSTAAPITIDAGGGTIDAGGNSVVLTGGLTGPGGLTTTGSGVVTLSGTNSYSGGTTVSAGTLIATSASAVPAGTGLAIGAGGTFIFGPSLGPNSSPLVAAAVPAIAGPAETTVASNVTAAATTGVGQPVASNAANSATSAATTGDASAPLATPATAQSTASSKVAATSSAPVVVASFIPLAQSSAAVGPLPFHPPSQFHGEASLTPSPAAVGPRPSIAERSVADLASLGPIASSSDLQHKKDVAIWALDAVFAEWGR